MRRPSLVSAAAVLLLGACSAFRAPSAPELPVPLILSRAEWGANAPVAPMQPHTLDRITIHHTATRQDTARTLVQKLRALQNFSQHEGALAGGGTKPVWPDVPYHYYIDWRGQIAEARDANYAGDTNTSYDPRGHLLIVLEGNFEVEQPTPAQLESMRRLVLAFVRSRDIPVERIATHKDFAETACPGQNLYTRIPALREYVQRNR